MSRSAASVLATPSPDPSLHDPAARIHVLQAGDWEVFAVRRGTPQFRRLRRCGGLHVQLWNPRHRVSVVTPSTLTQHRFEVCRFGERPVRVGKPPLLHRVVARICTTPLPPMREIALFVAWFTNGACGQPGRPTPTAREPRCGKGPRVKRHPESGDRSRRSRLVLVDDGDGPDPLGACEPETLRLLLLFLAVADPAAVLPFATPAADIPGRGSRGLCGVLGPAFAAALCSVAVRREVDRRLAAVFADGATGLPSPCLADLAQTWACHLREDGDGARLAAFLWAVARRPEGCFRKLEAKVRAHIEDGRQRLLLDVDSYFVREGA